MDSEDLFAYIRDVMMNDLIDLNEEDSGMRLMTMMSICMKYLQVMSKMKKSYEEMQEFIHDRQTNDWIDN